MEKKFSKTLAYFLRHAPGEANLEIDKFGFVDLEELILPLRERGWSQITVDDLRQKLLKSGQQRFELQAGRVRAKYGHSIEIKLDRQPVSDPGQLYHGTSRGAWKQIKTEGLKPQNRQYVHLSTTREEARRVGKRHDKCPVILTIVPPTETGSEFYQVSEKVVLTPEVPPEWIVDSSIEGG